MAPLSAAELLALSETDVTVRLTPEQFLPALSQAPFVNIEGTFNARDIGKLPASTASPSAGTVRPGFVFRSGMLARLTDRGKATLASDLGIRRVFDFRSQSEHAQAPDPTPADSVTLVWQETAEETPHVWLEPFAEGFGEAGFAQTYLDVLRAYRPTVKHLLEHVRDRPEEPFLFHCTGKNCFPLLTPRCTGSPTDLLAGRDRTGVLAALLLTLAGAAPDTIALDYMLSRIGSEPVRDELEKFARMGAGVPERKPDDSPEAIAAAVAATPPGFLNLINLRVVCWNAFLEALDKEHGGFEGYVTKTLGFSDGDVATIKKNLTTAP
ncbi:uncharacterized protein SPSK_01226 [Sporothrix schenckii 1099-18]|uniref:Tyrosine specific protein phosphatases domain-containing protein n=1 Tax=Sporothrix schenckii 1099-18 TaxID=1397361 RepID=A0A0F2LV63_SPOSC|nr:uncharacterized protein SPSK_01226 [Sporothrix schenckii 1099-18]KJR81353.1 hypothetical protein SPSK_01226 [Sporothrix schenckii 1099-18]